TGSYVNGAWSALAPMSTGRLYFGSRILQDGRLFVLGGEYSGPNLDQTFINTGEIYTPLTNTWKSIAPFPRPHFGDDPTALLPDGRILLGHIDSAETYIYNPATNTYAGPFNKLRNDKSSEESWVK